jgi:hypothetical protein
MCSAARARAAYGEGVGQREAEWGSPRRRRGGEAEEWLQGGGFLRQRGGCSGGLHRWVRVPAPSRMKDEVIDGRIEVGGGQSVKLTGQAAMAAAATNLVVAAVLQHLALDER